MDGSYIADEQLENVHPIYWKDGAFKVLSILYIKLVLTSYLSSVFALLLTIPNKICYIANNPVTSQVSVL
jgi:hypothetical protein